jgi:YYY domain-containing protein
MMEARSSQVHRPRLWFFAVLVIAVAVRFVGLNWDQNHHFHPDERAIAEAVLRISFDWPNIQLNPRWFNYGSLPIYVTRAVTTITGALHESLRPSYDNSILIGRAVSAAAGMLTVLLLMRLGTSLYDRRVGLLAGFLLAICVLHVQHSHFMTTDIFLTMIILWALSCMVGIVRRGWTRDYVLSGIAIGFALATKASAAPLLAPLGVAAVARLGKERRLFRTFGLGLLALIATAAGFFIGQPYGFIDFATFSRHVTEQSHMVRNAGLLPYTNQYIGTPKYGYEIIELVLWGMAPPLGLVAVWATVGRVVGALRERAWEHVVLLAWVVPYFLVTGWFEVKFIRYLLPIYPLMILWAAAWLDERSRRSRIGWLVQWTVILGTVLSLLAFLSIYQRPHTVVTASEWVYRHLPPSSIMLTQHWDEGFPFHLPGYSPRHFRIIELPYYEPDTPRKIEEISRRLAEADYIAFQTKRLYGAITRAPAKYPLTNNYFYLLFAGDLGYEIIYEHASRPSLFGFELPDELADESFTVYDHPKVLIFENKRRLSAEEVQQKIMSGIPSKKLTRTDLLRAGVERDGAAVLPESPPIRSSWAALIWFAAAVEIIGLSFFPVIYRWIPAPGSYAVAKVLGILVFAYIPWLLVSLGQVQFTRATLGGALAVLILYGLSARRRIREGPARAEVWCSELLFWGTFALFLTVRAFNPEVYWGEKPMDFAFLNALTRSVHLPPPEPWFSGSTLHYSYFGHYVVAALGKLCHIHPGITFNLGIALFGALTAIAAFAAGCAISDRWRVGFLAAFFCVLVGNLSGVRELVARKVVNFDYFWATSRVIKDTINEYPFWSFLFADLHAHVLVMPFSLTFVALALWWVRRRERWPELAGLPLLLLLAFVLGAIAVTNTWSTFTYVPFLPFLLGCASLAKSGLSFRRLFSAALILALLVPLSGLVHLAPALEPFIWPLRIGIAALALAVFTPSVALPSYAVAAVGGFLYYPYWSDWSPPERSWGWEGDAFAHLYDFANIFGLFLFVAVPFLFLLWRQQLLPPDRRRLRTGHAIIIFAVFLTVLGAFLVAEPSIRNQTGLPGTPSMRTGLALLAVLALHLALQRSTSSTHRLTAILFSFAFFVTAGVDVIHVWDRMNTVFKFYLESWLIFAVAAAAAAPAVWSGLIRTKLIRASWQAGLVLLVVVSAFTAWSGIYGIVRTNRVRTPKPSLDGTAYLAQRDPHEHAAIEWLNQNIPGIPVITEAWGPSYQDFSRISMNTGLPTVIGWEYHVFQRAHPWTDIRRRKADLERLYTADDPSMARAILEKYHVSLVYVGPIERRTYQGGNLQRFNDWKALFTPVYKNAGVSIFAVNGQFTGAMPVTTIEEVPREVVAEEEASAQAPPGEFRQPRGAAVDSQGNVYIADFDNHRIQKLDPQLNPLIAWGESGNLPGQFKQPCEVDVDERDTVYVADTWNGRVQVFDSGGQYLREWGSGLFGPRGIAVSASGKVYLVDTGNHRVLRFDTEGKQEASWGGPGSKPGQFSEPYGVAIDSKGRVYVCDNGNARLQIFSADGAFEAAFPVEGWERKVFSEPKVTITPRGIIWFTVPLRGAIRAYDQTGKLLQEIKGSDVATARFEKPLGIAYSRRAHEIIVADLENRVVRIPVPPALR